MSGANEPPVTNRGVKCPEKENLTVLIDWCQITVKNVTQRVIAEDILGIPLSLMRTDFRGGIRGYRPLMCFDDIRVFEPAGGNSDNGYQILMSGMGCRNFERLFSEGETWYDFFERVLQYDVNFPRIDLAIDDRKTYFKISKLIRLAEKGLVVSRLRIGSKQGSFLIKNADRMGDTINFGSRESELFMTFYEKNYEQAHKLGIPREDMIPKWNRYELKFRQKKAVQVVQQLVNTRDVAKIAMEILNQTIRFVRKPENSESTKVRTYPLWEPWEWFMRDVGKVKLSIEPKYKDYFERLIWLQTSIAPTLWVYREIDRHFGSHSLDKIIESATITKKHHEMKDDYIRQLETQKLSAAEIENLDNIIWLHGQGFHNAYEDVYEIPFTT